MRYTTIVSRCVRIGVVHCALCATLSTSGPARAQIADVNMFRNVSSMQIGNGNTTVPAGAFLSLGLDEGSPGAYDTVTVTYPGPGSPQGLTRVSSSSFAFQTPLLADKTAMDLAYPAGLYVYDANNAGGTDTTSLTYSADFYALTNPFLTGTNYTDLQGMNSAAPFDFMLSPHTPNPGIDPANAFDFLTIFDLTANMFVFNAGFLPFTTTDVILPGGTLAPGHSFIYELDFSDRQIQPPTAGATFPPQIGFDLRTDGLFSSAVPAAVPEPSALAWLSCGGLALLGLRRLRKSA